MLRPYQAEAVFNAERDLDTLGSTLIEAATGTGKTTSFGEVIRRRVARGEKVLVLAHRRELLKQAADHLRSLGLRVTRTVSLYGIADVVVASVQTVLRRLDRIPPDAFQLLVVDEAHHAASAGYMLVLSHFRDAKRLGVTATPDRADGVSLGVAFLGVAARYGIAEAVRDGWLTPARGLRVVVDGMDLSKVRQRTFQAKEGRLPVGDVRAPVVDLHPKDLGHAVIQPLAIDGVVGPLLELAEARRTVVFAVNRAHGKALTQALNARRPGCAAFVHGAMRASERDAVLAGHRAGGFQFLINVMLLTEGYDDPAIECVAMARPTQSRILYAQAVGRGLRLFAGKKHCLVLDFCGVSCQHDLVGPEDVLAGALEIPVRTLRTPPRPRSTPSEAPAYNQPAGRTVRFATKAVELVRRGAKRAGRWVWDIFNGD